MAKQNSNDEQIIARYLLGELSEEEQIRIEEQYFGNGDFFEQCLVVEDQLIDDYLRGQLPRRKRDRFETYFLASPRRRERVELARVLIKTVSETSAVTRGSSIASPELLASRRSSFISPRALSPALRFSITFATLLVIIGAAWLAFENARLRRQAQQHQIEQAAWQQREQELQQQIEESKARNDQLAGQVQREQEQSPAPVQEPARRQLSSIMSFALTPGLQRDGGGMSRLVIPQHVRTLRIKINFEPDQHYMNYGVVLRKVGAHRVAPLKSDRVLTLNKLHARSTVSGHLIVLNLPSRILPRGEYILSLRGMTASGSAEGVEDYAFSIAKD